MKKKLIACLMAVLLTVLAFNLAFAAEAGKANAAAPRPQITSCSWSGSKLSLSWTAVPGVKNYVVIAKSTDIRSCATVRANTKKLFVSNVPTGTCQNIVIVRPVERGAETVISRSACRGY